MDAIGAMPYSTINTMLDAGYPRGTLNYWKSNFLAGLSGEAIRTMIDCFAQCSTPLGQLLREHSHGAVTQIGATAFPHRADSYNLLVLSQWMEPKDNAARTAWARNPLPRCNPSWAPTAM